MSDTQNVNLVLDNLQHYPFYCKVVLHSYHGSIYTSAAYQQAIKAKGIIISMSRKGCPLIMPQSKRFMRHLEQKRLFRLITLFSRLLILASFKISAKYVTLNYNLSSLYFKHISNLCHLSSLILFFQPLS